MSNVRPPKRRIRNIDREARRHHEFSTARCRRRVSVLRRPPHRPSRLGRGMNACHFSSSKSSWATPGFNAKVESRFSPVANVRLAGPAEYRSAGFAGSAKASASPMPCGVRAFGCQGIAKCSLSRTKHERCSRPSILVRSTIHVVLEGRSIACAVA